MRKIAAIIVFSFFSLYISSFAEEKKEPAPAADKDVLAEKQDSFLRELKPGQPIVVDGDEVEYFEREKKIVARGSVKITYGDVKLECDSIDVYTDTRKAACRGNVRIESPDGTLTGDYIEYDLLAKRGAIETAEVEAYPWFGMAKETKRVGDNEYVLKKGYVTTCDMDSPHYRIAASEVRIFPNEKVIAKNAVLFAGKVPIFWFPYYYHPLTQSRSKIQIIPGHDGDWGYFLLSSLRFYLKGETKTDLIFDYRTKKGFAGGANIYYRLDDLWLKGLGYGLFHFYLAAQNDWGTYDPTPFRIDEPSDPTLRKRYRWVHRIDFDPKTVCMIEFNKISDKYFLKDYFYNEYEETEPEPQNYLSVVTCQENFMFSIEARKRFNDFLTVTQKLPEVKLNIPNQRLWRTHFYYSNDMIATIFDKEYADILHTEFPSRERVARFDTFHKLTYVAKLGFLKITPYGSFRETDYSRNLREDAFFHRETFGAGVNLSTRFHRIYDFSTNFLALNINGLRHIITPSFDYFYTHEPNLKAKDLLQMDELDALDKENGITLSLENKLQTKRRDPYGGLSGSVDLVRFIISTDYYFRLKRNWSGFKEQNSFENFKFDLELRPYEWLYIESNLEVEPKNSTAKTASLEFALTPKDLRVEFGYRYEKLPEESRNKATIDLNYRLSPKWRVGWYERYDFEKRMVEEQQYKIARDLHCWEIEFTCAVENNPIDSSNTKLEQNYTFWVAARLKAFPDLPIGLNRSFTRRPAGPVSNETTPQ